MTEPGLEYTKEAEAEREELSRVQQDEDWQEALSIAYACQSRVAVLASGRWAVWIAGQAPIILDNFEPEQMKKLIAGAQEADRLRREAWKPAQPGTSKTLEEMEL